MAAHEYYLRIGSDWIKVNGFDFTVATDITTGKGQDAYSGVLEFGSLTLRLDSDGLIPFLLQSSTLGQAEDYVLRVTETSSNPAIGEQAVYDLQLSGAYVTELQDNAFEGPGPKLVYSEIAVTTYATNALGVSVSSGRFD